MRASFTVHAYGRVLGRLSISLAELADLLDHGLTVDIGLEPNGRRRHRLFFSSVDEMCFVAVQDDLDGAVITVLPLDYHATLAWTVSLDAQQRARQLVRPHETEGDDDVKRPHSEVTGPPVFRVGAYLRGANGNLRGVNLGSWPAEPYDGVLERLLEDESFFAEIRRRLAERLRPGENVEGAYVRPGKKARAVRLHL